MGGVGGAVWFGAAGTLRWAPNASPPRSVRGGLTATRPGRTPAAPSSCSLTQPQNGPHRGTAGGARGAGRWAAGGRGRGSAHAPEPAPRCAPSRCPSRRRRPTPKASRGCRARPRRRSVAARPGPPVAFGWAFWGRWASSGRLASAPEGGSPDRAGPSTLVVSAAGWPGMRNLPNDRPVAETVSLWFAGDDNLRMSHTGRAIVRFSMPGLPVGRRLNPPSSQARAAEESGQPNGMRGGDLGKDVVPTVWQRARRPRPGVPARTTRQNNPPPWAGLGSAETGLIGSLFS
jgi:hypothetical protein